LKAGTDTGNNHAIDTIAVWKISCIFHTVIIIIGIAGQFIGFYVAVMDQPCIYTTIIVLIIVPICIRKAPCFKIAADLYLYIGIEPAFKREGNILKVQMGWLIFMNTPIVMSAFEHFVIVLNTITKCRYYQIL